MSILVIAEHDNSELKVATLNAVAAGMEIGGDIDILIAGSDCDAVADAASQIPGINQILLANKESYKNALAENIGNLVVELADGYSHIVTAATTNGKNFMPRVAAKLDVSQVSDISAVVSEDTFERPIYAGNCIATVQSTDSVKVITVRTTGFDACASTGGSATITQVDNDADAAISSFIKEEIAESDRPELTAADVVISGGRGMQNGDNFSLLNGIADKLGAAIGASRAAVDSGFVPNDMQVGQTGKIVAPDLYIAVGISGAIQHLAGMKDSKVIVAINKDEEAPIFQVADYGLVADLFDALPELEAKL
ncbi:FAD-binding protein [Gammaproteobacteria bacterium]|jgi:electron transfer flavoprotein alpha subunit|nr:electron transfer flavoprotein subunit alpha/FixB family protein [SAR86 cluster bacterium]MDB3880775.1 FAD-binding protein [Gammaproteobacteria bacterium]MDB3995116.1 FAD-binding protein [Gammaproteobacteria bacterium]MDC0577133.1 FAD-binding protein [Gammaproteobacteria bacterium]MDC0591194.1 FAD-binding protein [Gammaproteobacteria bacterium]